MAFPQSPLDKRVEMYALGQWTVITSDVLGNDKTISINRGLQNETSKLTTPGTCAFVLRNNAKAAYGARTYDSRWPTSPYYGTFGQGTPIRIGIRRVWDAFGRTVSNGWGSTDSGHAWTTAGGSASDYAVASGAGTHALSAAGDRVTWLAGYSQHCQDVATTWSMAISNVTGASILPAQIMLRVTDTSNHNLVRVTVGTDEKISLSYLSVVAGVETTLQTATDTGYTLTSGTRYRVRAVIEGQLCKAKLSPAASEEPYDWLWSFRTNDNSGAGGVGIRTSVAAGNTNLPVTVSYDDVEVMSPRFSGDITRAAQKQDQSGQNRWVEVEAADSLRRWQTGASPVLSTLHRGYLNATNQPVAYWPLEDGSDATQAAAAIGPLPMEVTKGAVRFGADSSFVCSLPIATPNNGTLHGSVPEYPDNDAQFRYLVVLPASGLSDGQALWTVHTTGDVGRWRLTWHTAGGLKLSWFAPDGTTLIGDSGVVAFDAVDVQWFMQFNLTQSGGDINWSFSALKPGETVGGAAGGTVLGRFFGQICDVHLTPDMDISSASFGHVSVQPTTDSLFTMGPPLTAWNNEFAAGRTVRLATENGATVGTWRSPISPEPWTKLGPQGVKTLVDLWEESVQADLGAFFATKSSPHLLHRTYPSMVGQTPRATINLAAHELAEPPLPVDDDQVLTNDVTAKQPSGTSARVVLTSGRLSTASPSAGGIGLVATSDTYNVYSAPYLQNVAGWKLSLGTYDGPRYPQITVARHQPEVVANATLSGALLDIEQGDVLLLRNLTPSDDRALVLGYREELGNFTHTITFNCVPGTVWNAGIADDSSSRADGDGSTLASSATSTATSLSVATTAGLPVWIDSAGYAAMFPVDIVVAGEQMTVTAISGTSSPQTFTVTRSVNGVVKAQSSGATVQLADPVYAVAGIQT